MECRDQLGYAVSLDKTPKRIVCLVPSLTELLVDLGLEENIVGVTKFCVHPSHIRKTKTIIGGTKTLKIDKLKQVKPNFILCNKEENTKEMVATCKEIAPTYVSDIITLDDVNSLIKNLGILLGCKVKSEHLINILNKQITSFNPINKNKNVAYFIWKDPWMTVGNNTFINHMLEFNGFKNIYGANNRYPEVKLEQLKEIDDLDAVLLSSEPYPFKEKHISLVKEILPNTKVVLVDGEYFSWYGSRLLKAFGYFNELHQLL